MGCPDLGDWWASGGEWARGSPCLGAGLVSKVHGLRFTGSWSDLERLNEG